jgi:hypothetical protein
MGRLGTQTGGPPSASVLDAAPYGDKVEAEITGKDGAPISIANETDVIETARRVAFLLGRGMERLEASQAHKLIEGKAEEQRSEG